MGTGAGRLGASQEFFILRLSIIPCCSRCSRVSAYGDWFENRDDLPALQSAHHWSPQRLQDCGTLLQETIVLVGICIVNDPFWLAVAYLYIEVPSGAEHGMTLQAHTSHDAFWDA